MKKNIIYILLSIILISCSEDYPHDELDFNQYGGIGRTNSYEYYGNFPLQLVTEEPILSDDSSGIVQSALRLKSPFTVVTTSKGNILRINNTTVDKYFKIDSTFVVATGMASDRNSNIYFIGSDDYIYSLNFELKLNWKQQIPILNSRTLSYSDLLATRDGIYVGTNTGDFIKFGFDGEIKWKYKSTYAIGKTFSSDTLGNLYIPITNNTFGDTDSLLCLDQSGKLKWQSAVPNTRLLSPAVYQGGRILVTGAKDKSNERIGTTFCFDVDGKLLWETESTLPGRNISIDFENNSYITSISSGVGEISTGLLAYDKDGKEIWKVYFGAAAISPPIICEKYVAFTGFTGEGAAMFFVRKSDGMMVRNHSLSNLPPLYLQPLVFDDATIRLFGSSKLKLIKFTETSLNKFLP